MSDKDGYAEAAELLAEARAVVQGDRAHYYGHPYDNHGCTIDLWNAYLRRIGTRELTRRDFCNMMVLMKVSRDANRSKDDNIVDIIGYALNAKISEFNPKGEDDGYQE